MFRHLHHGQIALGDPREQIGPSCDTQIRTANGNQRIIFRKNMHELFRHPFTGQKKQDGHCHAESKHDVKDIFQGASVALAPVLGSQNGPRRNRPQKHILDKLNLRSQGDGGHLILGDFSKHQRIPGRHRCQHQALKRNGKGKSYKIFVEYLFVNQHLMFFSCRFFSEPARYKGSFIWSANTSIFSLLKCRNIKFYL